jgi:hypothetical protein
MDTVTGGPAVTGDDCRLPGSCGVIRPVSRRSCYTRMSGRRQSSPAAQEVTPQYPPIMADVLTLPQAVVVLTLGMEQRRHPDPQRLAVAVAAAALTDLILRGDVAPRDGSLTVVNAEARRTPSLDRVATALEARSGQHAAGWWIRRLASKRLTAHVIDELRERGVVSAHERRGWFLRREVVHELREGGEAERALTEVEQVLMGMVPPTPRVAAAIAIVDAIGGLRLASGDVDAVRVAAVTSANWAAPEIQRVLPEIRVTMSSALVATTTAATTATTI